MTPAPTSSANRPLRIRIAAGIGITGAVLVFALALRSPTALFVGMLFAVIALALAIDRVARTVWREPMFWLAIALFVAVFLRGWLDLATAAERGFDPDPEAIWHHARYTPLLAMAFALWLAAYWQYRYVFLLLPGLGFVIYMANNWGNLREILPGGEDPFGTAFGEAGLMSGTLLFLLAAAAFGLARAPTRLRWPALGLALAFVLFALFVFIAAQSRATWLATIGTLLVLGAGGVWYLYRRASAAQRRTALIAGAAVAGVGAIALVVSWDILAGRLVQDSNTVSLLLSGEATRDNVPNGSIGDRYRMLRQGFIDIGNHPMWGVGPASIRDMTHEIWGKAWSGSGNYHCSWLNLPVAMGIPWTLLWVGVHAWAVLRAVRQLLFVDRDAVLAVAILGAALVHFGTLTFQVRIWSSGGSALYLILMALVLAVGLRAAVRRHGLAHPGAGQTTQVG